MSDDPRIEIAQAVSMEELVDRLQIGGLVRAGVELVGPCPSCGGRDRFGVNLKKGVFLCRRCDSKGDQIALVQLVLGYGFPAALEWLAGPRQELSAAQLAEQRRKADMNRRKRQEDAARYRAESIKRARAIWAAAQPADDTVVVDYLERRAIPLRDGSRLPKCFRFEPAARLVVEVPNSKREYQAVHEGPAMLSAILGPDDQLIAVHRTWIDLSQPKGRPVIDHPFLQDKRVDTKKVYGSKKGGAIRLFTPPRATGLIMGEGIETTLSVLRADAAKAAAYWAGVDLGNMSGQRILGQGQRYAGIPDMDDDQAFVPPLWVKSLIFIQDGDSEPRLTRAKLLSGLRRAMILRPGLRGKICKAGEGFDMNDWAMEAGDE